MAVSAREDATAVEDGYAPPASLRRTDTPGLRPAQMARGPDAAHGILLVRPVVTAAAMPVVQDHAALFGPHHDRRDGLTVARPGHAPAMAGPQHPSV